MKIIAKKFRLNSQFVFDILKTLPKLKQSLENFMKQLKSIFFLLKILYQGKNLEKEDKQHF